MRQFVLAQGPTTRSMSKRQLIDYQTFSYQFLVIKVVVLILFFSIFGLFVTTLEQSPIMVESKDNVDVLGNSEICWESFKQKKCNLENPSPGVCENLMLCLQKHEIIDNVLGEKNHFVILAILLLGLALFGGFNFTILKGLMIEMIRRNDT